MDFVSSQLGVRTEDCSWPYYLMSCCCRWDIFCFWRGLGHHCCFSLPKSAPYICIWVTEAMKICIVVFCLWWDEKNVKILILWMWWHGMERMFCATIWMLKNEMERSFYPIIWDGMVRFLGYVLLIHSIPSILHKLEKNNGVGWNVFHLTMPFHPILKYPNWNLKPFSSIPSLSMLDNTVNDCNDWFTINLQYSSFILNFSLVS